MNTLSFNERANSWYHLRNLMERNSYLVTRKCCFGSTFYNVAVVNVLLIFFALLIDRRISFSVLFLGFVVLFSFFRS